MVTKYYMIINKDKLNIGESRRYLTFAGGMFSNYMFGWSYKLHALLFTLEQLKHPDVIDYLKDFEYEIFEVDDVDKLKRKNFFI